MAYGTNKLSSCSGTSVAVWQYSRSGYIHWRTAAFACGGALCGSFLGAKLAMFLSETYLHYCLLAILPVVAVFLIFNRNFGKTPHPRSFSPAAASLLSVAIGLVLGCYDGFFGPGTGTFLVIAFTALLGQELTEATGNTKLVNLCSNVSALCAYLLGGKVLWTVGIPCGSLQHRRQLAGRPSGSSQGRFLHPASGAAVGGNALYQSCGGSDVEFSSPCKIPCPKKR